jgi:hypothetical protein
VEYGEYLAVPFNDEFNSFGNKKFISRGCCFYNYVFYTDA